MIASNDYVVGGLVWLALSAIIIIQSYIVSRHGTRLANMDRDQIVAIERLRFYRNKVNLRVGVGGFIFGGMLTLLLTLILDSELTLLRLLTGLSIAGLITGLLALYESGLSAEEIHQRFVPNQSIRDSALNGISRGLLGGFIRGFAIFVGITITVSFQKGLLTGLGLGIAMCMIFSTLFGGRAVFQHMALRRAIVDSGSMPLNLARFLNYVSSLILLRKVGGGYIFIHRYLLEYFADLDTSEVV